jgi:hypothetical protein
MTFCHILPMERLFKVSPISQHSGTPLALVPLFHGGNDVKSLSMLISHCPEIFWEEV